jgi:hypothetical protein
VRLLLGDKRGLFGTSRGVQIDCQYWPDHLVIVYVLRTSWFLRGYFKAVQSGPPQKDGSSRAGSFRLVDLYLLALIPARPHAVSTKVLGLQADPRYFFF